PAGRDGDLHARDQHFSPHRADYASEANGSRGRSRRPAHRLYNAVGRHLSCSVSKTSMYCTVSDVASITAISAETLSKTAAWPTACAVGWRAKWDGGGRPEDGHQVVNARNSGRSVRFSAASWRGNSSKLLRARRLASWRPPCPSNRRTTLSMMFAA